MQYTLQELTDKFHQALDHDSNVVDMRTVLEVISLLEDFPVTKETLGQTRVGKWVNDMRRKTKDKDLSRRAKNLVRRWKQMVDAAEAINGEGLAARPMGGQPQSIPPHLAKGVGSKPSSPISRPTTPSSGKSTQSPSLPSRSRSDTPSTHSRPNTPSSGQGYSPSLPLLKPGAVGSTDSPLARGLRDMTPAQAKSRFNHQSSTRPNHQGAGATSTPTQLPQTESTSAGTAESLSKTNATNKKRRRENDLNSLQNKKLNLGNNSVTGVDHKMSIKTPPNGIAPGVHARATLQRQDSPSTASPTAAVTPSSGVSASRLQRVGGPHSVPSPGGDRSVGDLLQATPSRSMSIAVKAEADRPRDRTPASSRKPKVKTTAELIQDMKAQGNLQLSSTEMSNRIARNQIEKEEDPVNVSVVPAGARPRPRRKPGTVVPPNISEKTLRETKTEMMHKFLQNSFNPMDSDHYERATPSPIRMDSHSRTASPAFNDSASYGGEPMMLHNNGSANASSESNEIHADMLTPFFTDDHNTRHVDQMAVPVIGEDDDPWSALPPLLPEVEIDWSEYVYEPPDRTVDDSHVDRLHTEHWPGVNGQYDHNNEWVDWTQMQSILSYGGDLLPILPYVDMD